ncbi:transposase [Kitasatospora indigofera]|nr:transposase [Kitasatospora indigofera]
MTDKIEPVVAPAGDALVDEVVERLTDRAGASGAALLGDGGLLTETTRAVPERALEAEMAEHLGYEKYDPAGRGSGNSRNGTSPKTELTDVGAVTVAVPRDRNGDFEPRLAPPGAPVGRQGSTSGSCPCTRVGRVGGQVCPAAFAGPYPALGQASSSTSCRESAAIDWWKMLTLA